MRNVEAEDRHSQQSSCTSVAERIAPMVLLCKSPPAAVGSFQPNALPKARAGTSPVLFGWGVGLLGRQRRRSPLKMAPIPPSAVPDSPFQRKGWGPKPLIFANVSPASPGFVVVPKVGNGFLPVDVGNEKTLVAINLHEHILESSQLGRSHRVDGAGARATPLAFLSYLFP